MNRKVFDVEVRLRTRVIGVDADEVEIKTREHIRKHPEWLELLVTGGESCELLEEWEVKK